MEGTVQIPVQELAHFVLEIGATLIGGLLVWSVRRTYSKMELFTIHVAKQEEKNSTTNEKLKDHDKRLIRVENKLAL